MKRLFRRGRLLPLLLIPIGACSGGERPAGPATDEEIAAIALPEQQLRIFLFRGTFGTQSGPMALYALGLAEGCKSLEKAVDAAASEHLPVWRQNLIGAYRENVPAAALADAVQKSPTGAQRELASFQAAIGRSMQAKSTATLQEAGVDVLELLSRDAARVDRQRIDGTARQQEMKEAMAAGGPCHEQLAKAAGGAS